MRINPFRRFFTRKLNSWEPVPTFPTHEEVEKAEKEIYENAFRKIKFRRIIDRKLSFYA